MLISALARFVRKTLATRQVMRRPASLKELTGIRSVLLRCLEDCAHTQAERLRQKIEQARSPQELWLLRSNAYQLISQQHSQSVAAARIDSLTPAFKGWIEADQITRSSPK